MGTDYVKVFNCYTDSMIKPPLKMMSYYLVL